MTKNQRSSHINWEKDKRKEPSRHPWAGSYRVRSVITPMQLAKLHEFGIDARLVSGKEEASELLDRIRDNRWKITPADKEKFGEKEGARPKNITAGMYRYLWTRDLRTDMDYDTAFSLIKQIKSDGKVMPWVREQWGNPRPDRTPVQWATDADYDNSWFHQFSLA